MQSRRGTPRSDARDPSGSGLSRFFGVHVDFSETANESDRQGYANREITMPSSAQTAKIDPLTPTDLKRFESGEITESEYLERHVELAMAHVDPYLTADRREMLREVVREMLEADPVLVGMKKRLLAKGRHTRNTPDT